MLKEQASLIKKINIVVDVLTVFTAFWLAHQLRKCYGGLLEISHYAWLLLIIVPFWIFLLNHFGFYSSLRASKFRKQFTSLLKVHFFGAIVVASTIYFIEPKGLSRSFFGIFITLSFFMIGSEQLLIRSVLRLLRLQGYNYRNILLVGTQQSAVEMIDLIEIHKGWGLRIVGIIQPDSGDLLESVRGHKVLGRLADLEAVCRRNQIDEVIFSTTREECRFDIANYILLLEEFGITVRTVLTLYNKFRSRTELNMFHDKVPIMSFNPTSITAENLFVKRCVDICGGLVGVGLLLLLAPFLAAAIRWESPGPIFFGQTRVGQNGRRFTCWKFRSMFIDAEERKKELLHLNEMDGAIFKMKNDPRVTKIGRFLRKTSLD